MQINQRLSLGVTRYSDKTWLHLRTRSQQQCVSLMLSEFRALLSKRSEIYSAGLTLKRQDVEETVKKKKRSAVKPLPAPAGDGEDYAQCELSDQLSD